jgi:hypothetical protein
MPHRSLRIAGGLAAALAMAATSAFAETAAEGKAAAAPYLADTETIIGTPGPVLGSVIDTNDLSSGSANVGLPYGDGYNSEDLELDDSVGKPVFAMVDRALAEKGKPSLAEQGVDTGMINQGLSLEGGQVGIGTMNAAPAATALMGSVSDLIGGVVP